MELIQLIRIISIIICVFGLIMHSVGIIAIILSKIRSIQTTILLHLSIVDIFLICWLVRRELYFYEDFHLNTYIDQEKMRILLYNTFPWNGTFYCLGSQFAFIMTVMTIDRLICVTKPLFYNTRMKRSFICKVLLMGWLYSITIGVVFGVFSTTQYSLYFFGLSLWVAYFVLAVSTYVTIFLRIRASKRRFASGTSTERSSWKFYIVSGLIVGTYFIFYLISGVVMSSMRSKPYTRQKCLIYEGFWILLAVGFASDAMIYVFLQKDFRYIVLGWFCNRRQNRRPNIHQFNINNTVQNFSNTCV